MNADERRSCEDKALHLRSSAFICGFIIITICGCARERRGTVIEPMSLERAMKLIDQREQWTERPPPRPPPPHLSDGFWYAFWL